MPKTVTDDPAQQLSDVEGELAQQRAALAAAVEAADAERVLRLRSSIEELELRITFARVHAARAALAAIAAEVCPDVERDYVAEIAGIQAEIDPCYARLQALIGQRNDLVFESEQPSRWRNEHANRLRVARGLLAAAEAAMGGDEPKQPEPAPVVMSGVGPWLLPTKSMEPQGPPRQGPTIDGMNPEGLREAFRGTGVRGGR